MRRFLILSLLLWCTAVGWAEPSDSLIKRHLQQLGITFSHNNSVALLMTGQEKFDDMFTAIREARSSVHLEYFNFRNDSITRELITILAEKVKEGVEVRALYDAFGNASNNRPLRKKHIRDIRAMGIEIYEFDPIRFPFVNHVFARDHRKIVVIDGKVGYTGGMNVADYYIHGKQDIGAWHDMHCRIEGDAVNQLQAIFLKTWNKVAKQQVQGPKYFRGLGDVSYFRGLKPDTSATAGRKQIGIINREPRVSNEIIREFYTNAIRFAKDSLTIVNPYFTLNHAIKRELRRAVKRGVKVEIVLSTRCDEPLTPDCGFYNAHKLMKRGCHIWLYEGGFHHTKIIMVDGRFCTVGSANLDARSLNFDYEENAVILDRGTTRELLHLINLEKAESFLLTPERWKQFRTPWQRFRGWFAHLLSPFL